MKTCIGIIAVSAVLGLAACGDRTPGDSTTTSRAPSTSTAPASPAAPATGPTAGQRVDDATLTAKVKTALLAESNVPGTAINVDTKGGQVTLRGRVENKSQIDRAVEVAKRVEGVQRVDNQLTASAG